MHGPVIEGDLEDEGYAVEGGDLRPKTAFVARGTVRIRAWKSQDLRRARSRYPAREWQKAGWTQLTRIPFGETRSLREEGSPRCPRASRCGQGCR